MTLIILASLFVGLLVCYGGYELFKGLISLAGALALGFFVATYCDSHQYGGFVTLLGFVLGAVIGGPLAFALYQVGVFFSGMYAGYFLAYYLQNGAPSGGVGIFFALVGGALALALEKPFIVIVTAFSGALAVVNGASLIFAGGQLSGQLDLKTYFE